MHGSSRRFIETTYLQSMGLRYDSLLVIGIFHAANVCEFVDAIQVRVDVLDQLHNKTTL
jgi:hypothetical protein